MATTDRLTALLSLFQALRSEIEKRSEAQATAVQLTVTAFGILGGLAFSEHATDKRPLLLVPIVAACLGMVWFDHAANIRYIGMFIKNDLQAALDGALETPLPNWETSVQCHQNEKLVILRIFGPTFIVFILMPVMAMVAAVALVPDRSWVFWTLFLVDCGLMLLVALYMQPHVAPILGGPVDRRLAACRASFRDWLGV